MMTKKKIKTGTCDEKIQPGIEPVEVAVLLSLIFDGISQMRPDLQMILESRGIDGKKFSHDVRQLVTVMITTPETDWENRKSPPGN